MKKSQPTRMCIACRSRQPQNTLIRLKQEGNEIVAFDGKGKVSKWLNQISPLRQTSETWRQPQMEMT